MNFYETFEITVRIFLMTLAFMAIYYYILISRKKTLDNRRKDTVNFFFQDKINYEKVIIENRQPDPNKEQDILEILGIFEKLAISIKCRVFDKEVLLEFYGKYMIHFYKEFKYFILKRREESGNPYLFIEYEKLVSQIENDVKFKTQNYYE
ncbi:MAG: DUF4760 domain-containing protein [Bacteroidales bacterium]